MTSISEDALRSSGGNVGPADERPLTDEERRVVTRLLGDPFAFPQTFKTWLVSFLEGSDLTIPLSSVLGLSQILGGAAGGDAGILGLLPAGAIFPFGGPVAPAGTLFCDGTSYVRTDYNRLFSAIGTAFGSVDASHFNVPDLRERIPVGKGTIAAHDTVGKSEGRAAGSRGTTHSHD